MTSLATAPTEQVELDLGLLPLRNPAFTSAAHDHAGRYGEWIAVNPWVIPAAERLAEQILQAGSSFVSMKEVWERLRRAYRGRFVGTAHAEFSANNNFTAYVARDVLARRPDWAERRVIRIRRTKS